MVALVIGSDAHAPSKAVAGRGPVGVGCAVGLAVAAAVAVAGVDAVGIAGADVGEIALAVVGCELDGQLVVCGGALAHAMTTSDTKSVWTKRFTLFLRPHATFIQ